MGLKTMKITFCRFLPDKWRRAALSLTLEEEGLLIRISALGMETGHRIEDRTTAARLLGVHRNKLNKLLPRLIERGEVVEDETGIYSPRAIAENERAYGKSSTGVDTPTDTPIVTRGVTRGVTHGVEAGKTQQKLRAILDKNRLDKKDIPPKSPKGDVSGIDHHPDQLDLIQDTDLRDEVPPPRLRRKPEQLPADFVQARSTWNEYAKAKGARQSLSPSPDKKLVKNVQEAVRKVGGQENWAKVCRAVTGDPWNTGQNDRGWKADLEFASRPSKIDQHYDKAMAWDEVSSPRPAPVAQRHAGFQVEGTPGLIAATYAKYGLKAP